MPCNVTMLQTLGATLKIPNFIPSFPHPLILFLNTCHMLKLTRNTPESNGILKDKEGNPIKLEYIKELNKLQEVEGLSLGNKLKNAHIQWHKQKLKVNNAARRA